MCEQTVLKFYISLRDTFHNSVFLTVISKYDKGAVMQISTMLQTVYYVFVKGSSETGVFKHLSKHVFAVNT